MTRKLLKNVGGKRQKDQHQHVGDDQVDVSIAEELFPPPAEFAVHRRSPFRRWPDMSARTSSGVVCFADASSVTSPKRREMILSASEKTCSKLWLIRITATFCAATCLINRAVASVWRRPSAAVGSSKMTRRRPLTVARGIAMAWRCPPEKRRTGLSRPGAQCPVRSASARFQAPPSGGQRNETGQVESGSSPGQA